MSDEDENENEWELSINLGNRLCDIMTAALLTFSCLRSCGFFAKPEVCSAHLHPSPADDPGVLPRGTTTCPVGHLRSFCVKKSLNGINNIQETVSSALHWPQQPDNLPIGLFIATGSSGYTERLEPLDVSSLRYARYLQQLPYLCVSMATNFPSLVKQPVARVLLSATRRRCEALR